MSRPDPATSLTDSGRTEVGSVFVSNYPPFSTWGPEGVPAVHDRLSRPGEPEVPLGLYLHVPFCRKRCKFCYFKVYIDKNAREVERYLSAMASEVERLATSPAGRRPLRFVYFGGGTPSFIAAKHLRALVARIRGVTDWSEVREVTFECEPGTLTEAKLDAIREVGVTRLSLGVENFDDRILEENGRAHVSKEIYRVAPWIAARGFDQVNIDLIAGMIGETWDSWRNTVAKTLEMSPDSVTIYQMELPFNTVYSRKILDTQEQLPVADWATKRAWQDWAFSRLEEAGYQASSAYTMVKPSAHSAFVYRNSVWRGCDLLGAGVASFSHLGGVHYQNESGWDRYLERTEGGELPVARALETTPEERFTREWILQLKLGRVELAPFLRKFGIRPEERFEEPLARLAGRGMLAVEDGAVRLSRKGLLQVDSLLPEFYAPRYRGTRYT